MISFNNFGINLLFYQLLIANTPGDNTKIKEKQGCFDWSNVPLVFGI